MEIYSKAVIKYFKKPHNMGVIKNFSGRGEVGNKICGDIMVLYIKVKKDKKGKERINQIKFQTMGCVAAISTSSVVTDLVKGKTLQQALKIDNKEVVKSLGGLPPIKIHCSLLAVDALNEAIYDYLSKNKKAIPEGLEKRHQKIEKEKKEIEKRYKKWIR